MVFRPKNFSYKFHYLLINIIILLYNIESKKIKLSLINNESKIEITFTNRGQNYFLSNNYSGQKPTSVSMTPENSSCNIESSYCNINKDNLKITLEFDENEPIFSCENMFKGLVNISKIDLSNFNTSQVTNMASMFEGCSNLTKITFGNMNTSNVKDMSGMFNNIFELTSLDLSKFNTSNVISMKKMFAGAKKLKFLNISYFTGTSFLSINNIL